ASAIDVNRLACAIAPVACAGFLAACSTTHEVSRPPNLESFAAETRAQGGRVEMIVAPEPGDSAVGDAAHSPTQFQSPPPVAARLLRVGGNEIEIAGRHAPRLVSLSDVTGYDVTRHVEGAVEGLGLGLVSGIAIGALVGFVAGDDPACDPNQ